MIVEALIDAVLAPFLSFLGMLPTVDTNFVDTWNNVRETLKDVFTGVGMIIPMYGVLPLIQFTIGLHGFRLAWAIILRIKSFIPLIGGN